LLEEEKADAQNRPRFRSLLNMEGRRRRDRRIPRAALQGPTQSAFLKLYESNNEQALITATGFDYAAFHGLLGLFAPIFDCYSPYSSDGKFHKLPPNEFGGRPRLIDSTMGLALVLVWTRTRGAEWSLSMLFGMTGTPIGVWLRFGRRILNRVLSRHPDGMVKLPDEETIETWKDAVAEKYEALDGVYCAVDGLKLCLEQSDCDEIQNQFYNGWTHDHYVSNLFAFAPDGTITACVLDCPGCCHDSEVAIIGNLYETLQTVYERNGGMVVMDSAFNKTAYEYIIKSGQRVRHELGPEQALIDRQATSARQFAEWGMRALQGSFPRLKNRFIYEERGERKHMLKCIVHLYNFRARRVGLNQITNVYMPELSKDANFLRFT
jgi:hypothetical protein